jgi:hypothetical protein
MWHHWSQLTCKSSVACQIKALGLGWSCPKLQGIFLHAVLHSKKCWTCCSTGLNNVLLPMLFTLVNNIEQCCWAWIGCNNIVQYCWQLWTMWVAKHCSILFSSVLQQPERFYACTVHSCHRIKTHRTEKVDSKCWHHGPNQCAYALYFQGICFTYFSYFILLGFILRKTYFSLTIRTRNILKETRNWYWGTNAWRQVSTNYVDNYSGNFALTKLGNLVIEIKK